MLNPSETNVAFKSVAKLVDVCLKAYPNASHEDIAKAAVVAWGDNRKKLEDTLTRYAKRKDQTMAVTASTNAAKAKLGDLRAIEPVLQAMMDIMRSQATASQPTLVKKAA